MWRNWQTRMVQVHVKAISWGFKSLHPHQKEQYPFGCCSFFVFDRGLEGHVLENNPVDCFPAPPLRPQAGKSLHPHQKIIKYSKKVLTNPHLFRIITLAVADVAELADAHGSGPCESNFMGVQVPSSAPKEQYPFGCCSFLFSIWCLKGAC